MIFMLQRITPQVRTRPQVFALCGVTLALILSYWWAREFVPVQLTSLWGAYLVAPAGWLLPAAVAVVALRALPQENPLADSEVDRRTVFCIAALVGLFLVALQIVVGMLWDFGRPPFAHSPRWLLTNAVFAGVPLVAIELSRTALLRAGRRYGLTLSLVVTSLGLAAIQFGVHQFMQDGLREQGQFWGSAFIPLAATGLLAGFFALYGGARAAILISAPLVMFTYWSPFHPVAAWPILALAGVAGPAMGLWIAEGLFEPEEESEPQGRFSLPGVSWVMTSILGLIIFWFSFGFLGYLPAFVPSHSMEPMIRQGDVVLTKDITADEVRVNDVVLYDGPGGRRVLHRVIEIRKDEDGARVFIFKGDNNNADDLFPVQDKQIRAKYLGRVPKLGWLPIKVNHGIQALR